uniref:Xaa-Pro aminopeptidase P n=1 Tax=Helicotheca tamesis TaxID=374047 RepID=A0A7S2MYP0_9STRA|mmetsp:Transcript_5946/g.8154  ORF Transcript_5946/g.8154 Transcript_5946/m.8154 type:complete len:676 (+) Transcript_5946:63-2090(+)
MPDTGSGTAASKLSALRSLMTEHNLDAYLILSPDAHNSEYVSDCDERRSYISGFTGSAGTALVTKDNALLWTDARYFLQAEKQLDGEYWSLMKMYEPGVPEVNEWISTNLKVGSRVGVDPTTFLKSRAVEWQNDWSKSTPSDGSPTVLVSIRENLVDAMWLDRPEVPMGPIAVHSLDVAGETVTSKLDRVKAAVARSKSDALMISSLDQVAWLFNLRGSDIMCNPLFFSYAVVDCRVVDDAAAPVVAAHIFVGRSADIEGGEGWDDWIGQGVKDHLSDASVAIHPYGSFKTKLSTILSDMAADRKDGAPLTVMVEKTSCSMEIADSITESGAAQIKETETVSPVEKFKSIKNEAEIAGLKSACLKDSGAMVKFLAYLTEHISGGKSGELREAGVCDVLTSYRKDLDGYVGDSFPAISSSGPNSAVIHYKPESGSDEERALSTDEMYLLDTGSHFLDGTTDVTRTTHFGSPSDEQKRCYTRVLQGHIGLAQVVFPRGTPGLMLDTLARSPLWKDGLIYGHGTGHGIGAYLNVHEGPLGIGGGNVPGDVIRVNPRMQAYYLEPIEAGMYVSDEPGYYKDGHWGIRIESDLVAEEVPENGDEESSYFPYGSTGNRTFLRFMNLTRVPMCRKLLDLSILSEGEIKWLNEYHKSVLEAVTPLVADDERALSWLQAETAPL